MKIGLLHYTMPPVVGGVERVLAAHIRLFREAGHEITLISSQTAPGFGKMGGFMENRDALVEWIVAQQLAVLFVHNVLTMPFSPAATAACHVLAASDLPVISWIHDLAANNPYYKVTVDDLLRKHPAGAQVVAISQERAEAYRTVTGYDQVKVVPNGVEIFEGLPEKLGAKLRGTFPILFHPTRMLRRKNIALGLRVTAELKKLGFTPRLLISAAPESFSGDQAAYRNELDTLVIELDLSTDVLFPGDQTALDESDIARLYEIADALFFPSEQEGFGLPVLEAGIRGLPLFVSKSQPLAPLAAQNGLAFPLNISPELLASQIADYFAHSASSHVRQAIRRDFDWQGIYQTHILPLLP